MRTKRQLISLMLMLALLLGMIPGVAVSALAEEIEIEGDLPENTGEGMLTDLDLGQIETAPALRTGAAPTETGTAEDFLTFEDGNEPLEKDVSKLNGSNWMAGIRGDAYLNDFNIPYTHDAAMKDYIYHWGTQSSGNFFGQGNYRINLFLSISDCPIQLGGILQRGGQFFAVPASRCLFRHHFVEYLFLRLQAHSHYSSSFQSPLPKRLLRFLFGDFCQVLVLTPGETVEGIEINEKRKDGNEDE